MLDLMELLLSAKERKQKREEKFSLIGEDDGKGCIVFHKYYLYNPSRKSKPIKIPVREFWGTADSFVDGVYQAKFLPEDKKISPEEAARKLSRFKKYLKASKPKKVKAKKSCCKKATCKKISAASCKKSTKKTAKKA